MPVEQLGDWGARYLTIIAGKLSQKVSEDTDGAIKREYDIDGNKGVKWELRYKNLSGFITWIEFKQSDYGEMCIVTIEQNWEVDKLTMNTDSRYFSDLGRKISNIDLSKTVFINPYDFEKNGKQIRWLDIKQDWEKITDAYYDWETKKTKKGFPAVSDEDKKKYDSDSWKVFFIQIKKYLKAEMEKIEFPTVDTGVKIEEKEDEISVEDLPF